ncbi:MAG TPA: class I SAM-dependent methyltransferase [Gaiellaceae bacterium]|nr:class I SAM-dependent methyltransferase [Gaiellaceae bacterium]
MAAAPLTIQGRLRWDVVRELLAPIDAETVLEVGAGGGALGARLAHRYEYTGVEPDAVSRARAERRLPGRIRADVPPSGSYDVLCAFEVLEHVADDEAVLRQWAELVRPGGHVLLSVPAWPRLFGRSDDAAGHHRRYEPQALRVLAERAGLIVVELRVYNPLGRLLHALRDVVARVRPPQGSGGSGRWLQPPERAGVLMWAAALPLRALQRALPGRGTGIVLLARKP